MARPWRPRDSAAPLSEEALRASGAVGSRARASRPESADLRQPKSRIVSFPSHTLRDQDRQTGRYYAAPFHLRSLAAIYGSEPREMGLFFSCPASEMRQGSSFRVAAYRTSELDAAMTNNKCEWVDASREP
ncbi:hypothetical protein MTO96_027175 [Rhipicephalus appendiculatus]